MCLSTHLQGNVSSRLSLTSNVTLTPLHVATADTQTRQQHSMMVATLVPRAIANHHPTDTQSTAPSSSHASTSARAAVCRSTCTAVAAAARSPTHHNRRLSGEGEDAETAEASEECVDACLATSHADPAVLTELLTNITASGEEEKPGVTGRAGEEAIEVPLSWYPSRRAVRTAHMHEKTLSWVC